MFVWECPYRDCPESFIGTEEDVVAGDSYIHLMTHRTEEEQL